ncbi:MAG: ImmA/IrrE family metallo-endopeptidase [Chloroflexi bacterium]|nr:ImmA/IrrE family metallo-endopeptidase [Chloroflexota bacterium]
MDTNILDTIDPRRLAAELQQARKQRGLTQEEAAGIIDVARTTIVAIEKGERRLRAAELVKLARAYGRQVSDFVRPRPPIAPVPVQFRGPSQPTERDLAAVSPVIAQLQDLARDYLELEELTASPLVRKYPPEYPAAGPPEPVAEAIALDERNRLGLGDGPIPRLRDLLEQDVGLRIFYLPLPPRYSETYIFSDVLGACIAINRHHPPERQRWSLTHAFLHFLCHRAESVVFAADAYQRRPEGERLADAFADFFLMPSGGLSRRFTDIVRTKGKATPADLITLAHYYGVSVEAMTRRLEMMKLLPAGLWERLREGGFKVREAQQQLGLESPPERISTFPLRYQFLAIDAFVRGLITEGRLARLLDVDRVEARLLVEQLRPDMDDAIGELVPDLDAPRPSDA